MPIGVIYFLAEPCIDEGLAAYCCTCVEHITNRLKPTRAITTLCSVGNQQMIRTAKSGSNGWATRQNSCRRACRTRLKVADSSVGLADRSVRACSPRWPRWRARVISYH